MIKKIMVVVILILQVISCIFTQKEIQMNYLLPRICLLGFFSLVFWLKFVPVIKNRKGKELVAEIHYEASMRFFGQKIGNSEEAGKAWLSMSIIVNRIILIILILIFLVLFISYVIINFSWIINHFVKFTRITGLIILFGSIYLFIRDAIKSKRDRGHIFTKENITIMGLIIENVLFSMIVFIY